MISLLLRQPVNIWRSLGRLNKIEVILLLGIIYAYLVGQIYHLLTRILENDWITSYGIASLTVQLFVVSIYLSGPFILLYLVPKQKTLIPFLTQPLDKKHFFQLTAYHYFKYQLIALIFAIPFLSAIIGINWLTAFWSLIILTGYSAVIFYAQTFLYIKISRRSTFLSIQLLILITFYLFYSLIFIVLPYQLLFDFIFLVGSSLLLKRVYDRLTNPELELIFPPARFRLKKSGTGKIDFSNIPTILPAKIQVLFNKEFVGLWRNPAYRRLKIITLIAYSILLSLFALTQIENKDIWMTVFTIAIIWIHYSNHFNEKYVLAEPDWFFKTLPLRFHQVWISKFMTEFIYIVAILAIFWILQIITGLDLNGQINLVGLVLIFSLFVLSVMLNFQIMFYEDPRLAGYAYHFTILFLLIMSVNYKLVGPLIGLILLVFYFYKSYKYFKV